MLISVVSFEEYPFGAMMTIFDKEKCSITAIHVGGKELMENMK